MINKSPIVCNLWCEIVEAQKEYCQLLVRETDQEWKDENALWPKQIWTKQQTNLKLVLHFRYFVQKSSKRACEIYFLIVYEVMKYTVSQI